MFCNKVFNLFSFVGCVIVPQSVLWAIKSPAKMKGLKNRNISFFLVQTCWLAELLADLMYTESEMLTDVACKFVSRVTSLCGTALLTNNATPQQLYYQSDYFIHKKYFKRQCIRTLRKVSCTHCASGMCLLTSNISSSKLALNSRQFHWTIL